MGKKNLWLCGLCLLGVGMLGLASSSTSLATELAPVGDDVAADVRGGQYCFIYYPWGTACGYEYCPVQYRYLDGGQFPDYGVAQYVWCLEGSVPLPYLYRLQYPCFGEPLNCFVGRSKCAPD